MATAAQLAANLANARRSTGPRTAEGKAASARNSTSHGLCSKDFVILEGQHQEFEEFISGLRADVAPVGALEHELFAQLAHAGWGLRRCRRAEVDSQFHDQCKGADPLLNFSMENRMKRLDLYARRAERTFHKALKELKALQTVRKRLEVLASAAAPELPAATLLVDPADLTPQIAARALAAERLSAAHSALETPDPLPAFRRPENSNGQTNPISPPRPALPATGAGSPVAAAAAMPARTSASNGAATRQARAGASTPALAA